MKNFRNQSIDLGPLKLPPPGILNNRAALDQWFLELTPQERGRYTNYLERVIADQPYQIRDQIRRNLAKLQASSTGLGWIGAVVGAATQAVIGAGTSIYNTKESSKLQQQLASTSAGTQINLALLDAATQQAMTETMTEAQAEAARIAGGAHIATAEQAAAASVARTAIVAKYAVPTLIIVGAVGGMVWWKSKKPRRR
jgi:hypothetical protein